MFNRTFSLKVPKGKKIWGSQTSFYETKNFLGEELVSDKQVQNNILF